MLYMNIYDFQMHGVIQYHGCFCYRTLQNTGHEIQDGGFLRNRHKAGKFRAKDSLFFRLPG